MQLDQYVHTLGRYLKGKFDNKVRKLTLNAAFTCPNRDGTLGKGGCTFCNVDSFSQQSATTPISEQLARGKKQLGNKAQQYLAYFQAYTSTYREVEYLKAQYQSALIEANIVGLCVGTRPDCVPDEVLQLLGSYVMQGYEVWLELGLQTSHDATLKRINRGHQFSAYQDAVNRAQKYGIKVCTHLILGLPGEGQTEVMQTLDKVLAEPLAGIKLHPLHIVEGSILAKAYRAGKVDVLDMDTYAQWAGDFIRHTPQEIIFHRVSATANKPMLIAPDWCQLRWPSVTAVCQNLAEHGGQGANTNSPLIIK
ncbi:TIGR01212 family radical SAM protein [Paraferrimonas sp. SM1919]|uniref:TIGR01212 family radical SAM protein n=1 Tax=Paraferrimonas sp. SM1919 TaxID=2662263 RepID=UPI0013D874FD|nr:TIGR01212 family radical SAM protein [Paraferrimonas sp. SM1919]